MATATKIKTTTEIPDIAQKVREQLLSAVQQGQKLSVDAAKTWAKAASVLAVPDLPKIPGLPAVPDLETATNYTFDVAADLLNAQRDFALKLTNLVLPVKSI